MSSRVVLLKDFNADLKFNTVQVLSTSETAGHVFVKLADDSRLLVASDDTHEIKEHALIHKSDTETVFSKEFLSQLAEKKLALPQLVITEPRPMASAFNSAESCNKLRDKENEDIIFGYEVQLGKKCECKAFFSVHLLKNKKTGVIRNIIPGNGTHPFYFIQDSLMPFETITRSDLDNVVPFKSGDFPGIVCSACVPLTTEDAYTLRSDLLESAQVRCALRGLGLCV